MKKLKGFKQFKSLGHAYFSQHMFLKRRGYELFAKVFT
jgi:hypothetical protein